jgi:hypothetical protein
MFSSSAKVRRHEVLGLFSRSKGKEDVEKKHNLFSGQTSACSWLFFFLKWRRRLERSFTGTLHVFEGIRWSEDCLVLEEGDLKASNDVHEEASNL